MTSAGEIVWEYINPNFKNGIEPGFTGKPNAFTSIFMADRNWIYRAQPVPYDWVPGNTMHSEEPVIPPEISSYRVTGG